MSKVTVDLLSVTRVGLDLAKHVFQVHAVDASGGMIDNRPIRRAKLLDWFAALPPCTVAMEACSTAHHSALRGCDLCAACVPEEVAQGHCDRRNGHCDGQGALEAGATRPRRKDQVK